MRRFKSFSDFEIFITGVFNSFQFVNPDQDGYDNFMFEILPILRGYHSTAQFPSNPGITRYLCFYKGSVVLTSHPLSSSANYMVSFTSKSIIVNTLID